MLNAYNYYNKIDYFQNLFQYYFVCWLNLFNQVNVIIIIIIIIIFFFFFFW
jgi:hypothetical protein